MGLSYINNLITTLTQSVGTIGAGIIALVAAAIGVFLAVKAILSFRKGNHTEAIKYVVSGVLVFMIAGLFTAGFFSTAGQNLATSDPNTLVSV